jgi:Cu+-exporting ATPase
MEIADVTLIKDDLRSIVSVAGLSRTATPNLWNLLFAFVFNALSMLIAAGVRYPFAGCSLR